jgi:putative ribosome biogenesis GTPase RsgA
LVSDVAGGASRVLVLRGDAGVGKSALLGYLSGEVKTWRIAAVTSCVHLCWNTSTSCQVRNATRSRRCSGSAPALFPIG